MAIGATAAAGCGSSKKSTTTTDTATDSQIKQVIAQLGTFSRAGDGKSICQQLLTRNLEVSIRRASKSGSCTTEIVRNVGSPTTSFKVQSVSVKQNYAVVHVQDQRGRASQMLMQNIAGTWRIARIG
jgi:hypothetical protein